MAQETHSSQKVLVLFAFLKRHAQQRTTLPTQQAFAPLLNIAFIPATSSAVSTIPASATSRLVFGLALTKHRLDIINPSPIEAQNFVDELGGVQTSGDVF
jgi:hypothetical protein